MSVSVIGAGAFGTALAVSLSGNAPVRLWTRSADHARVMNKEGENNLRLPGVPLPESLEVSSDMTWAAERDVLLVAVPMQQLRSVLTAYDRELGKKTLVACCKGMELKTGVGPISVIEQTLPNARVALLTGPSFAVDIARGLPTALTLACNDEAQGAYLQEHLTTANLRLYRTTDTLGAELGGALKNVIAIGCGAVIGAGLGDSARAALMTRGYAEMLRIATALRARPETLAGLSGFGDLALTCTSDLSRNYQLGLAIGRSEKFDSGITVEGSATARAMKDLSDRMAVDMPITNTIVALLDGEFSIVDAMASLLARPLKEE